MQAHRSCGRVAFHLLLGNAVIGVAEGLILAFLFRLKGAPCIANHDRRQLLLGLGWRRVPILRDHGALNLDLYNAWRWLWYMVAITYFFTLLLEWPFVVLCLRKTRRLVPQEHLGLAGCAVGQLFGPFRLVLGGERNIALY